MNAWLAKYGTLTNIVIAGALLALIFIGLASCQKSCAKAHGVAAAVAGGVADNEAKIRAEYEQQLAGKNQEIASAVKIGLDYKKKYEGLKTKIPVPVAAPKTDAELTVGMKAIGLREDVTVAVAVPTILNTQDATLIFTLDQEAKRAKALDDALAACDGALKAQEAVAKAQADALDISAKALTASRAVEAARAAQVQQLGKQVKVLEAQGWKQIVYPIAAAALTALVVKK